MYVCLGVGLSLAELEEHNVAVRQRHGQAARLRAQRRLLHRQRCLLRARARARPRARARAPLEHCGRDQPLPVLLRLPHPSVS